MVKRMLRRLLNAFERAYGHDMGYARMILDADLEALIKFARILGITRYEKDIPREAWYAAKLVATVAGARPSCTQWIATIAEREGVSPQVTRAVMINDVAAMSDDVALGYRFAQAVVSRCESDIEPLRTEVVDRWGPRALISLAFAVSIAPFFPVLESALGQREASIGLGVAPLILSHPGVA
jgi:hypothetical protein